jgi:type IVB pilus formation R64 PilN family outer membrane protein
MNLHPKLPSRFVASVSAIALLASCTNLHPSSDAAVSAVSDQQEQLAASHAKPTPYTPVTFSTTPYYGRRVRDAGHGDPLPSRTFRIGTERNWSLAEIGAEITAQTRIPVRVDDRGDDFRSTLDPQLASVINYANGNLTPGRAAAPAPIGARMVPRFDGELPGFLDQVATRFDVEWSFARGVLRFDRFITKIYAVPAAPAVDIVSNTISGATNSDTKSSGTNTQDLGTTTKLDVWADIDKALEKLVPKSGGYSTLRSTRQAIVYAPPEALRRVDAYMDGIKQALSPRLDIEIDSIYVDVTDGDDFGFDLNLAFANSKGIAAGLAGLVPTIVNAAGSSSIGIVNAPAGSKLAQFNGSQAVIRALATTGKLANVTHTWTVAQNNVPSPLRITTRQDYIKSVQFNTTGLSGTASTSATPDTINFGYGTQVIGSVVDGNQVDLLLTLTSSDEPTFTDRQVSTGTTIQLARQAQRGVQPRLVLTSGQTQIVGMYDQDVTTTTDSGQGSSKFLGLGGEQISNKRRVRLFLAVTATILPQNNTAPAVIAESK